MPFNHTEIVIITLYFFDTEAVAAYLLYSVMTSVSTCTFSSFLGSQPRITVKEYLHKNKKRFPIMLSWHALQTAVVSNLKHVEQSELVTFEDMLEIT